MSAKKEIAKEINSNNIRPWQIKSVKRLYELIIEPNIKRVYKELMKMPGVKESWLPLNTEQRGLRLKELMEGIVACLCQYIMPPPKMNKYQISDVLDIVEKETPLKKIRRNIEEIKNIKNKKYDLIEKAKRDKLHEETLRDGSHQAKEAVLEVITMGYLHKYGYTLEKISEITGANKIDIGKKLKKSDAISDDIYAYVYGKLPKGRYNAFHKRDRTESTEKYPKKGKKITKNRDSI